MAKKKVVVSEAKKQPEDTPLYWEDLKVAYAETANTLIAQMQLIIELMRVNMHILNARPELLKMARGLQLSYQDISKDIRNTAKMHAGIADNGSVCNFREGQIDSDSEESFDYIRIGAEYVMHSDKIAHLSATTHLDLIAQLNTSPEVKQAIEDFRDSVTVPAE